MPVVVDQQQDESVEWMVANGLRGREATDPLLQSDPVRRVRILARGLRRFHEAPMDPCPFDFRLAASLRVARDRLELGVRDPVEGSHSEHSRLTAAEAVAALERSRPANDYLVVCHGDYCPPNLLIAGNRVTRACFCPSMERHSIRDGSHSTDCSMTSSRNRLLISPVQRFPPRSKDRVLLASYSRYGGTDLKHSTKDEPIDDDGGGSTRTSAGRESAIRLKRAGP